MPEKLGTMPLPAVEPEAWECVWKAYPRSWKQLLRALVQKMARGTEQCCYSACLGMCVGVSECTDLEFLCPSCPAGAKTWPTRAALRSHMMSKHGWRNPWRQFVAGSCCPVCQKQFHTRARPVDHLAHRAERCRQAMQQDPDLFPKLNTDIQRKLDQQDQQERRKAVKPGEILADGVSSGGLMQNRLSVTVARNVELCSTQQAVSSSSFFVCAPMSLKLVIT